MPLNAILHHWTDFFWGGADASHDDADHHVDHAEQTALVAAPFHRGSSLRNHNLDVYSSFLTASHSTSSSVARKHSAFFELPSFDIPLDKIRARAHKKLEFYQHAASDFQRTRLWYKGKFYTKQHLRKWGLVEGFGLGALLGGLALYNAPLPAPTNKPKSAKEAAVDAFKAKRAAGYTTSGMEETIVYPKLPGDHFKYPPSHGSTASTKAGSGLSSLSSASHAKSSRGRGRRAMPRDDDSFGTDDEAEDGSMSD